MQEPKMTDVVEFFPNERMKEDRFPQSRMKKKSFAAIITDVNKDTVDLAVLTGSGLLDIGRMPHKDDAEGNVSYWDWPKAEEKPKKEK